MVPQQENQVAKLLADLGRDLEEARRSGADLDLRARYEPQIRSLGPIDVLTELFLNHEDTRLMRYLYPLAFFWKDVSFSQWQEVLRRISGSTQAIYQFVWFASPYLGLDVFSMIHGDPEVQDSAKEFVSRHFPRGAPRGGSHEQEVMEDIGIDPVAMWRRLAHEGAPMKVDLPGLP